MIQELFNLPPRKAVEFLKSKGLRLSFDWQDTLAEAHDRAFTITKVLEADLLQQARESLAKAISQGETFEMWRAQLPDELANLGKNKLKTIYRTNLQSNYAQARDDWATKAGIPYFEYVAVLDQVTRPTHAALSGKVFAAADPFWVHFSPPNGYRCRCRKVPRSQRWVNRNIEKLESSNGKLSNILRRLSNTSGVIEEVPVYAARQPDGRVIDVTPDRGWSRNWQPDLKKYDRDIRAGLEAALDARRRAITLPTGVEIPANGLSRYRVQSEVSLGKLDGWKVDTEVTRRGGYVAQRGTTSKSVLRLGRALAIGGSRVQIDGNQVKADGQKLTLVNLIKIVASGLWGLIRR